MIKHSFAPCKYGINTIVPIHEESNRNTLESIRYMDVDLSSLFDTILYNWILIIHQIVCSLIHYNLATKKIR